MLFGVGGMWREVIYDRRNQLFALIATCRPLRLHVNAYRERVKTVFCFWMWLRLTSVRQSLQRIRKMSGKLD